MKLLGTVCFVTSLTLEIPAVTERLLNSFSCLIHLEVLHILAFGIYTDYYAEDRVPWEQCKSLRILSVESKDDAGSSLMDWIKSFGNGLRTLSIKGSGTFTQHLSMTIWKLFVFLAFAISRSL